MARQTMYNVEDLCRKLRPIMGEKADKLYFNYLTCENRETKEEILSMLHMLYRRHFDEILQDTALLEPPSKEQAAGDYKIGGVYYAENKVNDFYLREEEMPRHVCVSGMSGSGKTTMALNLLDDLITARKPFLVFDWKKSFRPLLKKDPSTVCFTIGNSNLTNDFKVNLNKPPKGVNPKEWITVLCDLIAESFFVSYGVHKILVETLDEAYKMYGVYKGSEKYPTWNNIKWMLEERLEKAKGREQGWIESALRVAMVLTFGDFGKVLNYKGENKIDVEDIFSKRVVFELNALGNIEKKFFCEYILTYIYKLKKAKEEKAREHFNYAILVDEAHNIFLKNKTNFVSESVTDRVYREMREYGVSLICLDQHISKLSDTVKGNSACHIAFQQQLPEDIEEVSRLMQLSDRKDTFSQLNVGEGVVRISGRYTKPFFIRTEHNRRDDLTVNDEEIRGRVKNFHLKEEYRKDEEPGFNRSVESGTAMDLNQMLRNINLKQTLESNTEEPRKKEEGQAEEKKMTPASNTIYATIKRRLMQGEEIDEIERQMESVYDSSDVNRAINKVLEEEIIGGVIEKTELKSAKIEDTIFPEAKSILPKSLREKKEPQEKTENSFDLSKGIPGPWNKQAKKTKGARTNKKEEDQKSYKLPFDSDIYSGLSLEEKKIVDFLLEDPQHKLTTVKLYSQVGLSTRKGNIAKNRLKEKGVIRVEEIKHEKGWKKIIRLKKGQRNDVNGINKKDQTNIQKKYQINQVTT